MRATDIIMKKRGIAARDKKTGYLKNVTTGTELSPEEIRFLISGYVNGEIPDYQMSAWLMAVYFNGMTFAETGVLTDAMLHSGDVIELHNRENEGLNGPFVDKHSTGGVGDKISLPLAPIVASCGVQIPMMSGRALGHTGGTLDKLESIKGYRTNLTPAEFATLIARTGYAMTGQTKEIVPADRLLYALRDVTGTVESVPLITSSILSKKIAEGSDALVFDVKCGSGAFMKTPEAAEELATCLVKTAQAMGKKASALITDMDKPLGRKIGNFLEIEETMDCLQGKGPQDVMELTYALGAEMLMLAGKCPTLGQAEGMCRQAVASGNAYKCFMQNVADQGGSPDKLMKAYGTQRSKHHVEYRAKQEGFLKLDAYGIGLAGVYLGVGRNRKEDSVCADAGFIVHVPQGDYVHAGDLLMDVYGKDSACMAPALAQLDKAVTYSQQLIKNNPLIIKEIR